MFEYNVAEENTHIDIYGQIIHISKRVDYSKHIICNTSVPQPFQFLNKISHPLTNRPLTAPPCCENTIKSTDITHVVLNMRNK